MSLRPALLLTLLLFTSTLWSQETARTEKNIPYKKGADLSAYEKERCRLDLYLPAGKPSGFPTFIWLHGGGIYSSSKDGLQSVAATFTREGIAFVAINYRLSPQATFPAYVDDTAAAFAWVHSHIAQYGGDPRRIFLGGHSAGAYLSSLVGMDIRYLQKYGLTDQDIAGLIPISGQMMTHFTVRKERGIAENTITADEAAPIYYTREKTPPFLIFMGDDDWPARFEENAYFAAIMKAAGNQGVTLRQIPGRDHGSIGTRIPEPGDPVAREIIEFIKKPSATSPVAP